MSTRSTTHFKWTADEDSTAIIYRHSDGYPEGHGRFLVEFLDDLQQNVRDTRFGDSSYLAAKLVVALAREFNVSYSFDDGKPVVTQKDHPLDFLSVGIVSVDPGDIEYRYEVICSGGRPLVNVYERVGFGEPMKFNLLGSVEDVLAGYAKDQERV